MARARAKGHELGAAQRRILCIAADIPFGEQGRRVTIAGHTARLPFGPWSIALRANALLIRHNLTADAIVVTAGDTPAVAEQHIRTGWAGSWRGSLLGILARHNLCSAPYSSASCASGCDCEASPSSRSISPDGSG